jgi:PHD/YefM family antitoxin component YafN of YafNO toxin-antitoxin module
MTVRPISSREGSWVSRRETLRTQHHPVQARVQVCLPATSGRQIWCGHLPEPLPCSGAGPPDPVVSMSLMSELPAGDTHDVIHRGNEVVAVVVPIVEYQQLREALKEQRVNEEFDAARASYLARKEAGAVRYVPHEEARAATWVCLPGELPGQLGDPGS